MAARPSPETGSCEFERRYALWADLDARFGSARSYPYAWRLPELARQADATARRQAALALARTLYAMGRFADALAALPDADGQTDPAVLETRAHCLWLLGEDDAARADAARIAYPDRRDTLRARATFAYLADDGADATPPVWAYCAAAGRQGRHAAWAALLACWLQPGHDPARPHAALAWLRQHQPARAAEGEALFAEARLRQAPADALVWLEHALDQVEKYGQHHLKARLLFQKAAALEAAGQLGVAAKFQSLARETAKRQGAWRYLGEMAP